MILVAAHAIDVMVVDHSHQWNPGLNQSSDYPEVCHFVNVSEVWLKHFQRCFDAHFIALAPQRKAMRKSLLPGGLISASGWTVNNSNSVSALPQFRRRDVRVGFGASHCAESLVYKK